jgi:predicted DNA-binding transcriptional regulator YafY
MPESVTKNRIRRLFNLHKVMRDMEARSADELAAELENTEPPTNKRLIKEDLDLLRKMGASIPAGNKHRGYKYTEPFSFAAAADGIDFENVRDFLNYLEQVHSRFPRLEALGIDKVFFSVLGKIKSQDKNLLKPVQFHEVEYHGYHFIGDFYRYIKESKPILVRYQPFGLEEREVLFMPQLLREYNHRWFVIGTSSTRENPEIFALDRVLDIQPAFLANFPKKPIPNLYRLYKDVLGVSLEGERPSQIILRIAKPRADYVRTKKWHRSQKVLEDKSTSILFSWYLWPNRELKTKIMEYLPYIEEIEPPALRDWLIETLKESLGRIKGKSNSQKQRDGLFF